MQVAPPSNSRFDRLPAWQRAATLVLAVLGICIVLLLLAEAGVRLRNKMRHGDFWGIEETYTLDRMSGLRIPVPGVRFGPILIKFVRFSESGNNRGQTVRSRPNRLPRWLDDLLRRGQ